MELNIDPNFSVFEIARRVRSETTVLNHRRTMNIVSYEIENVTLHGEARNRIFAGFQRMSRFLPQMERYRKMAAHAESVYVFGVPDVEVPAIENITYIPLASTDQLAREWFLVSLGGNYASALVTEEKTHIDDRDSDRLFRGIWSHDYDLVLILEEWLRNSINVDVLMEATLGIFYKERSLSIVRNTIEKFEARMEKKLRLPEDMTVRQELDALMRTMLKPYVFQHSAN